jgi:hypothetical protein
MTLSTLAQLVHDIGGPLAAVEAAAAVDQIHRWWP